VKTIELTAVVNPDRTITVQLPPEISPGEHRVVLVIEEQVQAEPQRRPLQFSAYPIGLVSDTFTFRREDLYDDDGR
jgi:hypothetical protein